MLADAGWDVLVLEARDEPGGAVKSAELVEPGFTSDLFSAFHPLAVASPAMRALALEDHGLRWRRAAVAVAHPAADGSCPLVAFDLDESAASLGVDGDAWRRLMARWAAVEPALLEALFTPFPPLRASARLAAAVGLARLPGFLRFATRSYRGLGEAAFRTEPARRLLAGNAMHADVAPGSPGGGFFGWLLSGLAQTHGWPSPAGGAGRLTDALVARLRAAGGEVRCGAEVARVDVRGGRAVGVVTVGGERVAARRAVLADVSAPALYERLLDRPAWKRAELRWWFRWDPSTVKVDWTLDAPIPWAAEGARRAGTVHLGDDVFLVLGQYAPVDPGRAPEGREVAWAYTHIAQGAEWTGVPERMEEEVERLAPGFRASIRARHVFTPPLLEAADANLVGGALNGGTARLGRQLFLRPTPSSLGRPETPVRALYLASASAHPGGGVHGACGANAAHAALRRA